MLDSQQIYAPDREVCRSDGDIAIGRRLFRLLPEDVHDTGPIVGQGGVAMLVADIRIDNREDLCRALAVPPEEARRTSDAAILMKCWERWEEDGVGKIVGDFAFALWEGRRRRLILARDYLGKRPLHYSQTDRFVAFASMPKGLHALPGVPRAPDLSMLADFTALLPEAPGRSFFEQVERVMPGHIVSITSTGVSSTRFWRPDVSPLRLRDAGEYEEALREEFERAVAARLRGVTDAAAAHLSAGLDSSTVAATAARLMQPSGQRLVAYTSAPRLGYEQAGLSKVIADESANAAAVAAMHPNIEHVVIRNDGSSPGTGIDRGFFLYDRPVLNSCNMVWSDAINDAAKARRLKVLLTGQSGNMSISYAGMTLLPNLLASGRLLELARVSAGLISNGTRWGTVAAQTIGPFLPRPVWRTIAKWRGKGAGVLSHTAINPQALHDLDLDRRAGESGLDFDYRPRRDGIAMRLWVLGRTDTGNYVKGTLAGWQIDQRDPTADRRVMEFCLRVPDRQYLSGGVPRSLVRRAFADRLPPEVVREVRKGYQGADWHEGLLAGADALRGEVARIASVPAATGLLDTDRMDRLLHELPTGSWHSDAVTRQYRLALLRGISVGHFIRKAVGSNQ